MTLRSLSREELIQEIECLHEELDFYADAINHSVKNIQTGLTVIQEDAGEKAREALYQSRKLLRWEDAE